jgi:hypothetical protein
MWFLFLVFLFLLAVILTMLGFIWHEDGWRKALIILLLLVGSMFLTGFAAVGLGVDPNSATRHVISVVFWIAWALGLVLYNQLR